MNTVLELRALTKHYPSHRAVNGISFCLERGEFFSLLGPSGCGKTTTLRLIAGFETPTSGDIVLNGQPVANLRPYQRNVSTVFQNYALFPHLSVAQNIAFGLERRPGAQRAEVARRVDEVISLLQLAGKEQRRPSEISGGERQRVALARSLILAPDVLLLDEPLSALDPKLRKQVRSELKSLQRRVGITFLFITHDQEEALSLSDRMAVMNRGEIEQVGTPRVLYRQPCSRFVAEFLGDVNWIGTAAVRPESLHLSRERPADNATCHVAVVTAITYLGNHFQLELDVENAGRCVVQLPASDYRFRIGDSVHVWWNRADELPVNMPERSEIPAGA